ncbi:MAG: esterase-like activity of phytase family protein [Gemmataceae bacterium]
MRHFVAIALSLLLLGSAPLAYGDPQLIASVSVPGNLKDVAPKGKATDPGRRIRLGGFGSAIAYLGNGNDYFMLADRGPGDAEPFQCRFHRVEIVPDLLRKSLKFTLRETILLKDQNGDPFLGSPSHAKIGSHGGPLHLDPEGIAVGPRKSVFIADEYGPSVLEFSMQGILIRALGVPNRFAVERPDPDPKKELAANRKGRVPNRGFEGLTISPDGKRLFAMLQSPLIQDGGRDSVNIRLLEIDLETQGTREFVVPLANRHYGVNEVLAVDDKRLLCLERDGDGGTDAKFKKLMWADLSAASDVSGVAAIPNKVLPPDIRPASVRPFLDLLAPDHGLAGAGFPDKIEGMCFGPTLPDGRRLLLVTSDNDFHSDQPTRIWGFAVPATDLTK